MSVAADQNEPSRWARVRLWLRSGPRRFLTRRRKRQAKRARDRALRYLRESLREAGDGLAPMWVRNDRDQASLEGDEEWLALVTEPELSPRESSPQTPISSEEAPSSTRPRRTPVWAEKPAEPDVPRLWTVPRPRPIEHGRLDFPERPWGRPARRVTLWSVAILALVLIAGWAMTQGLPGLALLAAVALGIAAWRLTRAAWERRITSEDTLIRTARRALLRRREEQATAAGPLKTDDPPRGRADG